MDKGFKNNAIKVEASPDEVDVVLKKYKNIKKYMKSSLYEVKKIDGTEKIVSQLIDEYNQNPME